MSPILIKSKETIDADFGEVGLRVSAQKSSPTVKSEREWWLLRRYLKSLYENDLIASALLITKSETPDFLIQGSDIDGIEITEATTQKDRKEAARLTSSSTQGKLLGCYGGRGRDGFAGREPEILVAEDVKQAISRKQKAFKNMNETRCHLLIYTNSNPASVFSDSDDELKFLGNTIQEYICRERAKFAVAVFIKGKIILYRREAIAIIPCSK